MPEWGLFKMIGIRQGEQYIFGMAAKPKLRLELDGAWLRACFDLTAQEKRALSIVLALALLGLAARAWFRTHSASVPSVTQTDMENTRP